MNWRHGTLRLWIAASALWILAVFALAWPVVTPVVQAAIDANPFDALASLPVECRYARGTSGVDYQAAGPLCFYEEAAFRKLYPDNKREWIDIMTEQHEMLGLSYSPPPQPWPLVLRWSLLGVLPPIGVFALGLLVLWVARGFRRPA